MLKVGLLVMVYYLIKLNELIQVLFDSPCIYSQSVDGSKCLSECELFLTAYQNATIVQISFNCNPKCITTCPVKIQKLETPLILLSQHNFHCTRALNFGKGPEKRQIRNSLFFWPSLTFSPYLMYNRRWCKMLELVLLPISTR